MASIAAGKSVVFIEGNAAGTTDSALATAYVNNWFGGVTPAGLQIGFYGGSGIGLGNTEIGSPGVIAAIPEPETYALFLAGLGVVEISKTGVTLGSMTFSGWPAASTNTDADNLLVSRLGSRRLVETTRAGNMLSSFDLSAVTTQAIEGVTVDELGTIYLVAEDSGSSSSRLFVLTPVPEPETYAMLLVGLALADILSLGGHDPGLTRAAARGSIAH